MPRTDRLHVGLPFAGARMPRGLLQEGFNVGRKPVATLMRRMGLEALYRKARTTQCDAAYKIFLYLLRNLAVMRVNHVGAMYVVSPIGQGVWRDNIFVERLWRSLK